MPVIIIIFIVFLIDRITKMYISKNVPEGSYHEVIEDKLYITNVKNSGAAYGFLAKKPGLLMAGTVAAISWAALSLFRGLRSKGGFLETLPFAFILGGAVGNITDRIFLKRVTDFIYVKPKKWKGAPIFNVADVSILIGTLLYVIKDIFFIEGKK